jgi:hypothetical protein
MPRRYLSDIATDDPAAGVATLYRNSHAASRSAPVHAAAVPTALHPSWTDYRGFQGLALTMSKDAQIMCRSR